MEKSNTMNDNGRYFSYESYKESLGIDNGKEKSHFESKSRFRSDLSQYSLSKQTITAGSNCKWDSANCSGIPIDFDSERKTVYVDGSDAHSLLIGSTGSKKSRLIAMPTVYTLAAAKENMIVCDPKGEIYRRTAAFLTDKGYRIQVLNFREPKYSDCWNILAIPFSLYRSGEIDKACEYVNDMTINLIPIVAKDPYWDYCARDVLFGLTILLFRLCMRYELPDSYVNMQSLLQLKSELFCSVYRDEIQQTAIWQFAKNEPLTRMRLYGTIVCPDKTLSCIISTFDQHMSCFSMQPQIAEILSGGNFEIEEIGFQPTAVFLILPDEKTTYHKIAAIVIKQLYEFLIDGAYKRTTYNRFPSRINFVLDEFSSLPAISDFPQMISAARSRNIRFVLVVQSMHQLRQRYGEETETIMSNCANWFFLTTREIELLQNISVLGGTIGTNREPLISISRLQHLDKDKGECLVMAGRKYPYISYLPDIDQYDIDSSSQWSGDTERKHSPLTRLEVHFFEHLTSPSDDSNDTAEKTDSDVETKKRKKDLIDLQTELETSFSDDSNDSAEKTDSDAKTEEKEKDSIALQKELELKFNELFGVFGDNKKKNSSSSFNPK